MIHWVEKVNGAKKKSGKNYTVMYLTEEGTIERLEIQPGEYAEYTQKQAMVIAKRQNTLSKELKKLTQ